MDRDAAIGIAAEIDPAMAERLRFVYERALWDEYEERQTPAINGRIAWGLPDVWQAAEAMIDQAVADGSLQPGPVTGESGAL